MHTGKSYKLSEFLNWTRRDICVLIVLGVVAVVAYQIGNIKWLGIPSTVVALLGTATAFIVGFKNFQTYNRTWEARQIWGDIISSSRAWGTMSRDFFDNAEKSTELSLSPPRLVDCIALSAEGEQGMGNHKQGIQCRVFEVLLHP